MKPKPRYVVVEGIDGCGKSELTVAIKKCIERRDGRCDAFKVPSYDGPIGKLIRNAFDGDVQIDANRLRSSASSTTPSSRSSSVNTPRR